MASASSQPQSTTEVAITTRDILFECPSCGKSLVVDESAEGLTINCPQCRINVIVPPKPRPAAPPPPAPAAPAKPAVAAEPAPGAPAKPPAVDVAGLQKRLSGVTQHLKELQTQRTELANRVTSNLNDINRDMLMMARLESSLTHAIGELTMLIREISESLEGADASEPKPGGRSRVSFRG